MSSNVVAQIKERVSLVQYISKYVKLTQKGDKHVGLCPFHPEKTPSFTVNDKKGFYYCFGCGKGGDVISFLESIDNQSFQDVLAYLAKETGIELQAYKPDETYNDLGKALQEFVWCAKENLSKDAKAYLHGRGLNQTTVEEYSLGYVDGKLLARFDQVPLETKKLLGIDNRLINRILFPIFKRGKPIGFGARVLSGDGVKYINSPESPLFQKKQVLYGESAIGMKRGEKLLLVEGYTDALIVNQETPYKAVAALGTAVSLEHIEQIIRENAVLCFDGDIAGQKACMRALLLALKVFLPGYELKVTTMKLGYDPASAILFDKENFLSLIENAQQMSAYMFDILFDQEDCSPEQLMKKQQIMKGWYREIGNEHVKKMFKDQWSSGFKNYMQGVKLKQVGKKKRMNVRTKPNLNQFLIFTILLEYPQLLADVQEELAEIIVAEKLEPLKQKILNQESLEELDYLVEYCKNLKHNLPTFNADEEALKYWLMLYKKIQQDTYMIELEKLKKEFMESFSSETWKKIQYLQKLIT